MAATVLEQGAVFGDTIPRGSWVAGDILYAFVANDSSSTLQTPSGWTATPGSDAEVGIFFRQLTPADDAVTSWTFTSAGGSVVFIRYVVIRGGGAVDAYTGVVNASGAAHTVSLTTTSDDSLLVVLGASNAGGTWSLPAGWTPVYNSGEIIATRVQATAGPTGNVTFTAAGSAEAWLAMIAVSPPAASVTIDSVTPDELSDGLTGVVIAGSGFSDSGNEVWLTTTPDPQGRPAIDSRGDPLAVTNGTSNALDVPAHEAGDLLIAIASHDTSGALAISGWTAITNANNGTACRLAVFALLATGNSHTATLTGSNNDTVAQVFRIAKGHHAVTDVSTDIRVGTAATGNNAAPNPPSVGSLTATVPYLVLAIAGSDDDDDTPSYAPSGYTPELQQQSASSTSSCLLQIASLQALGITSVDPGTFSLAATEEWVAQTVVIPGHAAVEQTVTDEDEDEITITVDLGDLPAGPGYLHVRTADNVWSNAAAVTLVEAGYFQPAWALGSNVMIQ